MAVQNSLRFAGMIFGAWLSWLYAFLADEVNRIYLPGIPLSEPQGGILGYYGGAILAGLLVGLACTWPENKWMGTLLGGLTGALLSFIAPWQQASGSALQALGAVVLTITAFVPLAVLLMPIALLVRISVERLPSIGETVTLRRIWLPLLATGLVAYVGFSKLYPQDVRNAFYYTQALIEEGMHSSSANQLPDALQDVEGFIPNANGRYILEWSDNVGLFMGPHPVTARENSDFLIIARYANGFSMACIFAPGSKQPPCAVFQ